LLALPLALAAHHGLAQGVTDEMLLNAHKESDNWRMVGRDYMSTRFSPLTQVNAKNVRRLVPKWTFSFGVLDAQNTTPLIHNGVMYVTASHGRTFAVNARTGSMIWQYNHPLPEDAGKNMCCDIGNRGAALYGDKVFVSTPDAHVVALDMKTGKPVWDVALSNYKNAYSMTVAPLIA
jgi:alcohol dehydrogenase (cytochrome c)